MTPTGTTRRHPEGETIRVMLVDDHAIVRNGLRQFLVEAVYSERRVLGSAAVLMVALLVFQSSLVYHFEHDAQPDKYGSIPDAMWWAIVTITTLGYGDVTPVTLVGRLIASVTMVTGYVMLGLPVGIVATAFSEEIHRREFVVTWSMLSRVPLFHGLDANSIAEIMRYLRAQTFPGGTMIVREGETAHSMYFIASGQIELERPNHEKALIGEGDFFGELAVINPSPRTTTARAVSRSNLLVLDATDLRILMAERTELGRRVEEAAQSDRTTSLDDSATEIKS